MTPGMRVEVCYALPGRAWRVEVALAPGATVADALAAADLPSKVPGLVVDQTRLAVFGHPVAPHDPLHDGDRLELLRPLIADPKQARRQRAARAGNG